MDRQWHGKRLGMKYTVQNNTEELNWPEVHPLCPSKTTTAMTPRDYAF